MIIYFRIEEESPRFESSDLEQCKSINSSSDNVITLRTQRAVLWGILSKYINEGTTLTNANDKTPNGCAPR